MPKENIPLDMAKFADSGIDLDVFPVSARKGRNIKNLREFLISSMPEGGKVFEEEIVSDKSERFMIAEIMREKILLKYDKEIPHGVAVVVNIFRLGENGGFVFRAAGHGKIPRQEGISHDVRESQGRLAGQAGAHEGVRLRGISGTLSGEKLLSENCTARFVKP